MTTGEEEEVERYASQWQSGGHGLTEAASRLREHLAPKPCRFDARDRYALAFLIQEAERLRALLRRIEWPSDSHIDTESGECPCCGMKRRDGHADGCELAAALGRPTTEAP